MSKFSVPTCKCDRCGRTEEMRSGDGYEEDQLPIGWTTLTIKPHSGTRDDKDLCSVCFEVVHKALFS